MKAAQAAIESSDGHIRLDELFPEKYDPLKKHYALQESYDLSEIKRQSTNAWLGYFLWLNTSTDNSRAEKKWVDFEKEIHQVLVDVAHLKRSIELFENETKSRYNNLICRGKSVPQSGEKRLAIHESSFDRLAAALNWNVEYEALSTKYAAVNIGVVKEYQTPREIGPHLYEQLQTFAEIFKTYLRQLVVPIFESKKFDQLAIEAPTYVITFNYTPIASILGFACNYLHGDIDTDIIFGIDSADGLLDELGSDVLSFTKYFQSIFHRTFASQFKQPEFHTSHLNHYHFYGHSFDLSDRSYIKVIFDSVKKESSQKVTIYYHSEESRASILRNLLDPRMLGNDAQEKIESLIAEGRLSFDIKKSLLPESS